MNSWEKELISHNIIKGINVTINSGDLLEKAKTGFYADTPENRERGIVGMPYRKENGSQNLPKKSSLNSKKFQIKKEINDLKNKITELRKEGKTKEANILSDKLKSKIKNLS